MSIKYNEFGEVVSVNGLTTGQHLGTAMQDALGTEEENSPYGTELSTIGNSKNVIDDAQPTPSGGSGSASLETCNIRFVISVNDGYGDDRSFTAQYTTINDNGEPTIERLDWKVGDHFGEYESGSTVENIKVVCGTLMYVMDNYLNGCASSTVLNSISYAQDVWVIPHSLSDTTISITL